MISRTHGSKDRYLSTDAADIGKRDSGCAGKVNSRPPSARRARRCRKRDLPAVRSLGAEIKSVYQSFANRQKGLIEASWMIGAGGRCKGHRQNPDSSAHHGLRPPAKVVRAKQQGSLGVRWGQAFPWVDKPVGCTPCSVLWWCVALPLM
jgi:hypothetical protein